MRGLPATCTKCGLAFESGYVLSNSTITMEDCLAECPECGGDALVENGTYTEAGDVLTVIRGLTWADAARLREVFEAQRQEKEADGLIDAVTAISPELGAALNGAKGRGVAFAVLVFFVWLLLTKCSVSVNVDLDINELWDQAHRAVASEQLDEPKRQERQSDGEPAGPGPGKEKGQTQA